MNGYTLMAQSYRTAAAQGKIDQEQAEKYIKVFDFLAGCDKEEICCLVDSTAFNDIIKGYLRAVIENAKVTKKTEEKLLDEVRFILDEYTAAQILERR